jgi:hypothetical protein
VMNYVFDTDVDFVVTVIYRQHLASASDGQVTTINLL